MKKQKSEKKTAVILGFINTAATAIISIAYIPILLTYIGKTEYGLYQLIGSIIAYFATMYSSLNSSVMKYYTEYLIRGDKIKMENTLALSKKVFIKISVILLIISVPFAFGFRNIYEGSLTETELNEAIIMFYVMIVNLLVYLNNSVYSASILAHERFVFKKSLDLASTVLQPIFIVLLIIKYPYALTIVVIQLFLNVVIAILNIYYSKFKLNVKIKYHYNDKKLTHGLLNLSSSVLLISIADQIFWRTDQLILGKLYGTSTVAIYSIGSQLNTVYINVGIVIVSVLLPMVTSIIENDENNKKLSEVFAKIGRYQSYLVILILSGVVLFGKEFIYLIAGKEFEGAYVVALLLMVPYTIDLIQNMGNVVLVTKNKNWYKAVSLFSAAIVNIFLTYFLAKKYGMYGAAAATTISIVFSSWIILNIVYYKVIKLDMKLFWKNVMPIILMGVILVFLGRFILLINIPNKYIQFVIHVMIYLILYVSSMSVFIMNSEERKKVFGKILNKI